MRRRKKTRISKKLPKIIRFSPQPFILTTPKAVKAFRKNFPRYRPRPKLGDNILI